MPPSRWKDLDSRVLSVCRLREKSRLTDYVGELTTEKLRDLDNALLVALGISTNARASF